MPVDTTGLANFYYNLFSYDPIGVTIPTSGAYYDPQPAKFGKSTGTLLVLGILGGIMIVAYLIFQK